jgi:hypothetical protein
MIVTFEVVATGRLDSAAPLSAPHQPKPVRISAGLFAGDRQWGGIDVLVRPDDWRVPAEVERHGISHAMAARYGIPLKAALAPLVHLSRCATRAVAYDLEHAETVIQAACAHLGLPGPWLRPGIERVCLMRAARPVVKKPGTDPLDQERYADPAFEEACQAVIPQFQAPSRLAGLQRLFCQLTAMGAIA